MKNTLLTLAVLLSVQLMGQQTIHFDESPAPCGFDQEMEMYMQQHPDHRQDFVRQLREISEHMPSVAKRSGGKNIFPVVVHVIHDNGNGNIDLDQVENAIELLNAHYRREHADTAATRNEFKNLAGSAPFEFRLAKIDPNGNPTDGVVRVNDPNNTYNVRNNVKSVSSWPSYAYFNMWIVNSIRSSGGGGGTVLGYAQFPGSSPWSTYGLVMRHDQFGVIGTASNSDGMTLVHEMGHCLGLLHTFQGGCGSNCSNSGDYVCDTPPISGASYDCNPSRNTCSNDAFGSDVGVNGENISLSGNLPDQIENYMSYNSCQNMFTIGQVSRMIATYNYYSRLQGLASENNLKATGVGSLSYANFTSSNQLICAGEQVTFTDKSEYDPEVINWTFAGGEPSTATSPTAQVKYENTGVFNVSLQVSDGDTTTIRKTKSRYVAVFPRVGTYLPVVENFNDVNSVDQSWVIVNPDDDVSRWTYELNVGNGDQKSYKMNNYDGVEDQIDELYTTTFDASPLKKVTVSFDYAYARKTNSDNDRLVVYVSNDCGNTWTPAYSITASRVTTSNLYPNSPFVPTASEWDNASFDISETRLSENLVEGLRFKFELESGGGNNLYIDNFELSGEFKDYPLLVLPEDESTVNEVDVTLDWKSMGNVDYYEYEIDEFSGFNSTLKKSGQLNWATNLPDGPDTEFQVAGLAQGKTYFWRVRGFKNGQPTDWSEEREFTVSATASTSDAAESLDVTIYPNPTNGSFQVTHSSDNLVNVTVIRADGVEVYNSRVTSNEAVDISEQASGVYIVQVKVEGKQPKRYRLIKQ